MNAQEKFAMERDAFERRALGLPERQFASPAERQAFARELLVKEETRRGKKP
jgi:hypothetical protein